MYTYIYIIASGRPPLNTCLYFQYERFMAVSCLVLMLYAALFSGPVADPSVGAAHQRLSFSMARFMLVYLYGAPAGPSLPWAGLLVNRELFLEVELFGNQAGHRTDPK